MRERPSVLIVEDNVLIALDIQAFLEDSGFQVSGPAGSVKEALRLFDAQRPHIALLDINLGIEDSFGVADMLADAKVPFVFLSGNSADVLPARFNGAHLMEKPIHYENLIRLLRETLQGTDCTPATE